MNKNRPSDPAIAVAAAVCAGLLTFAFLVTTRAADRKALQYQLAAAKDSVQVVVAARNIAKGTLIHDEDIGYKSVPRAYLAMDAVSRKSRVIGRETVSEVFAGEAILSKRLSGASRRRASTGIRAGRVALAIGTDEIASVAGGIRAGDRVDIFITDEDSRKTRLFLVDARVLGIGGVYPFSARQDADEEGDKEAPSIATGMTVVLELTPGQAGRLTQASETGKVRLALRAIK